MKKFNLLFTSNKNIIARKDGETVDYKAILTGVIAKLYKEANGELAALLQSDTATAKEITDKILDADKTRIAGFAGKFQEGYKKAEAKVWADVETAIKSKFGIDEDAEGYELTGNELVDFVVKKQTAEGSKATGANKDLSKLTAAEIKALPGYHEIEKETKATIKKLKEDGEKALKEVEERFGKESVFTDFTKEALAALKELNPVESTIPKIAQNIQAKFLEEFKGYEIRKNEDGTFTFLKDNKVVEDGHGNSLDWKEHIKNTAAGFYEFAENNGGANSGSSQTAGKEAKEGGKLTYPTGVVAPKTFEEYTKLIRSKETSVEDRKVIQQVWNENNSNTGDL